MLSKYFASSASYVLNEGLMHLKDRDSLAQLLAGLQLLVTVEPEVLEVTSSTNRQAALLPSASRASNMTHALAISFLFSSRCCQVSQPPCAGSTGC